VVCPDAQQPVAELGEKGGVSEHQPLASAWDVWLRLELGLSQFWQERNPPDKLAELQGGYKVQRNTAS